VLYKSHDTMSEIQEPGEADVSAALSESENEYDEHDPDSQLREDHDKMDGNHASPDADGNGEVKKKYDPKDPMRPRRKKARRACYACQRAHLTCGMSHFLQAVFFPISCLSRVCLAGTMAAGLGGALYR
jgi:hypothetical protein